MLHFQDSKGTFPVSIVPIKTKKGLFQYQQVPIKTPSHKKIQGTVQFVASPRAYGKVRKYPFYSRKARITKNFKKGNFTKTKAKEI